MHIHNNVTVAGTVLAEDGILIQPKVVNVLSDATEFTVDWAVNSTWILNFEAVLDSEVLIKFVNGSTSIANHKLIIVQSDSHAVLTFDTDGDYAISRDLSEEVNVNDKVTVLDFTYDGISTETKSGTYHLSAAPQQDSSLDIKSFSLASDDLDTDVTIGNSDADGPSYFIVNHGFSAEAIDVNIFEGGAKIFPDKVVTVDADNIEIWFSPGLPVAADNVVADIIKIK